MANSKELRFILGATKRGSGLKDAAKDFSSLANTVARTGAGVAAASKKFGLLEGAMGKLVAQFGPAALAEARRAEAQLGGLADTLNRSGFASSSMPGQVRGGQVVPNNQLSGMSSTINVVVNVGSVANDVDVNRMAERVAAEIQRASG